MAKHTLGGSVRKAVPYLCEKSSPGRPESKKGRGSATYCILCVFSYICIDILAKVFSRCLYLNLENFITRAAYDTQLGMISLSRIAALNIGRVWSIERIFLVRVLQNLSTKGAKRLHTFVVYKGPIFTTTLILRTMGYRIYLAIALFIMLIAGCSKSEPERPAQGQQTQQPADPPLPQLTLDNAAALYAYAGESTKYTFKVTGQSAASAKISGGTCVNATIKAVEYNAQSGLGSVTVELDKSSLEAGYAKINLAVSVGSKSTKYDYSITPYYIKVKESVTVPGEAGKEIITTLILGTNIPDFAPVVSVNADWVSYADGKLKTLQDNRTGEEREAAILVNDSGNHFGGLSVKVLQPTLGPAPVPGCVVFAEWPMKRACVAVADANGDGEVSFEEAMNTKKLDISNKGIVNVKGLEEFRRLEELNCSGNKISKLIMDDPASFAFLRTIDARNNSSNIDINCGGCWAGNKITLLYDPSINIKSDCKDYTSTKNDFASIERLQLHTKGKGIIIKINTEALYDIDYESGAARSIAMAIMESLFAFEPIKSLKEYFDVFFFNCLENTSYDELRKKSPEYVDYIIDKNKYENGYFNLRISYVKKFEGFLSDIINSDALGKASLFSINNSSNRIELRQVKRIGIFFPVIQDDVLLHEFGHAMGGLGEQYKKNSKNKYYPNYSTNSSPEMVPWSKFINHSNYTDRVGIYELFEGGFWPSPKSFMLASGSAAKYFDSPSRYAIYNNIIQVANQDENKKWKYTDEETWNMFLEYDVINNNIPY